VGNTTKTRRGIGRKKKRQQNKRQGTMEEKGKKARGKMKHVILKEQNKIEADGGHVTPIHAVVTKPTTCCYVNTSRSSPNLTHALRHNAAVSTFAWQLHKHLDKLTIF
jgi:hypothetical protein